MLAFYLFIGICAVAAVLSIGATMLSSRISRNDPFEEG